MKLFNIGQDKTPEIPHNKVAGEPVVAPAEAPAATVGQAIAHELARDVADVRRGDVKLTPNEIQSRLEPARTKFGQSPAWPMVEAELKNILATRKLDNYNVGILVTDLAPALYAKLNDAKAPPATRKDADEILAHLNNEVFGNKIAMSAVNFRDNVVTVAEMTELSALHAKYPQYFPWTLANLDAKPKSQIALAQQAARMTDGEVGKEPLLAYYQATFKAFAAGKKDNAEALKEWDKKGAENEARLVLFRKDGADGLRDAMKALGDAPSTQQVIDWVKKNHSVMGGMSLTTRGDAILTEYCTMVTDKLAEQIGGELAKEDGVRFKLDNPWTWLSIFLAVVSLVMLFVPGGTAVSIACGLASFGLFAFELFLDYKSGHLQAPRSDDGWYKRGLKAPKEFGALDYSRALDTKSAAFAGRDEKTMGLGEAVALAAASDAVVYPADRRPVLWETPFKDKTGAAVPVTVHELKRGENNTVTAVGYDNQMQKVEMTLTPDKVVFPLNTTGMPLETMVNAISERMKPGQDPAAGVVGSYVTVAGEHGEPTVVQLTAVACDLGEAKTASGAEHPATITLKGVTALGQEVTIERTTTGTSEPRPAVVQHRLAEITSDAREQKLILGWMKGAQPSAAGQPSPLDADNPVISNQLYAQFLNSVREKPEQFTRFENPPFAGKALLALQAAFAGSIQGSFADVTYIGDDEWQTTADKDVLSNYRPSDVKGAVQRELKAQVGEQQVWMYAHGVDYQSNTHTLSYETPAGVAYAVDVDLSKGKKPSVRALRRGGAEVKLSSAEGKALLDKLAFTGELLGNSQMRYGLTIEANGAVQSRVAGAKGSKRKDVDDLCLLQVMKPTQVASPSQPAIPVKANQEIHWGKAPTFDVAFTRHEVQPDGKIKLNNRRITHYVITALQILLLLISWNARKKAEKTKEPEKPQEPTKPTDPTDPTTPTTPPGTTTTPPGTTTTPPGTTTTPPGTTTTPGTPGGGIGSGRGGVTTPTPGAPTTPSPGTRIVDAQAPSNPGRAVDTVPTASGAPGGAVGAGRGGAVVQAPVLESAGSSTRAATIQAPAAAPVAGTPVESALSGVSAPVSGGIASGRGLGQVSAAVQAPVSTAQVANSTLPASEAVRSAISQSGTADAAVDALVSASTRIPKP